jgi:hypothetical protein
MYIKTSRRALKGHFFRKHVALPLKAKPYPLKTLKKPLFDESLILYH